MSFRLLHVFELRGDKISREQVWCDSQNWHHSP
jgi:hypothetical protein